MKLILEVHPPHGSHESVTHVAVEKFPFRIGRGFDNDLILNDPYASVKHAEISAADGLHSGVAFNVHDLGSENGVVQMNDKGAVTTRRAASAPLRSGDRLRLGMTEIRVYDPHHALPPALPVQKENALLARLSRPAVAWGLFAASVAGIMCWTYLEVWSEEVRLALASAGGGAALVVLLWAGIWAAAGRLIRHRSLFVAHLGLFSLYMLLSTLFWYAETYINFLSNENLAATIVSYGLNFLLLTPLLYGALRLATNMPRRRRRFAALFFAGGLVGGTLLFSAISQKNFEPAPFYAATLEPYLASLAPARTVPEYMAENKALFDE